MELLFIDPDRVNDVYSDCVRTRNSGASDIGQLRVLAQEIVYFKLKELKKHNEKIINSLNLLPEVFFEAEDMDGGLIGGGSFYDLMYDNKERLWTAKHRTIEKLVLLGNAIGKSYFITDRERLVDMHGRPPFVAIKR